MMKWVSLGALIGTAIFREYVLNYGWALGFIIALGAILVAIQAYGASKYKWTAIFCLVAVAFNPFLFAGSFPDKVALVMAGAGATLFARSLYALKTQPLLSAPSITDRTPGSQSL